LEEEPHIINNNTSRRNNQSMFKLSIRDDEIKSSRRGKSASAREGGFTESSQRYL
jgi:hypothetical protein